MFQVWLWKEKEIYFVQMYLIKCKYFDLQTAQLKRMKWQWGTWGTWVGYLAGPHKVIKWVDLIIFACSAFVSKTSHKRHIPKGPDALEPQGSDHHPPAYNTKSSLKKAVPGLVRWGHVDVMISVSDSGKVTHGLWNHSWYMWYLFFSLFHSSCWT